MKPIFTKKRVLISLALFTLFTGTAAYFHFRDDPAPDLSRFAAPAYDAEAYARVKTLSENIRSHYKVYHPVETGDIDEATSDLSLDDLALRRDPAALRCLRRHLDENKAALADAEALLSLSKYSLPPVTAENPFAIDDTAIVSTKTAASLCQRSGILAAIDGDTDEAWRIFAVIASGSRARMTASGNLITYLTNAATDGITRDLAVKISACDPDAARIGKAGALLDNIRPESKDLGRALEGELKLFQLALPRMREILKGSEAMMEKLSDDILKATGGKKHSPPPFWKRWAKATANWTEHNWSLLNTLPNATMSEYTSRLELVLKSPDVLVPEKPPESVAFYSRNYGGRSLVLMTTGALHIVQGRQLGRIAEHRLTRLALALRVYQLSHDGQYPATLDAATAGFTPEDLTDPFDGKALRYDAKSGKVWSVGKDLKDDAGFVDEDGESKDIVVAPPVCTLTPANPAE